MTALTPSSRRYLVLLALLFLLAGALVPSGPLFASSDDHELARQALERGQVLPLRTISMQASRTE